MKYRRILCFSALLLVGLVSFALQSISPARADGPTPLKFGEAVTGEFTNQVQEIRYSFTAKKLDYIDLTAINIGIDRTAAKQLSGKIVVLDPAQQQIADGSWLSYGPSPVIGLVGADGVYTVVLTPDKSSSDAVTTGKFKVLLQQASSLEIGKTVKGNVHKDADGLSYRVAYLVAADTPLKVRFSAPESSLREDWVQMGFTPVPTADALSGFYSVSYQQKGYLTLDGLYGGEESSVLPASATPYLLTIAGNSISTPPSRDFSLTVESAKP